MDWAMDDERLKVEMFRFVDVFPTLRSGGDIARHLREYFLQEGVDPPRALALGARRRRVRTRRCCRSPSPRSAARCWLMARRFIVGRDAAARRPRPASASATRAWASRSTCSARPR